MKPRFEIPSLLVHAAFVGVAAWVATDAAEWLFLAGGLAVLSTLAMGRRPPAIAAAQALALAAVMLGFAGEWHLDRISEEWNERAARWEARAERRLEESLDQVLLTGEAAVTRLVRRVEEEGSPGSVLPASDVRPDGIDAVALFGPAGELLAWEGHHQGPVPRPVRLGLTPYHYEEGALFGYAYVTRPLPEGQGTAVAASLLRADLPPGLEDIRGDFVSRFRRWTGAEIHVARADRAEGPSVFDMRWEDQVLFSVSLVPPSEAEVRERTQRRWRLALGLMLFLGWGMLAWGTRGVLRERAVSAGALIVLLLVLPVGILIGPARLFSPADLLLPLPVRLTLGDLLVVGAAGVVVLGFLPADRIRRIRPWVAATVGVGVSVLFLLLAGAGASRDLLAGSEWVWIAYQGGVVLVLTALMTPVALAGRAEGEEFRPGLLALCATLALALGMAAALRVRATASFPLIAAGAWVLPLLLLLRALGSDGRWRTGALRVVGIATVAVTLVLPWSWGARVEARMAAAEDRIDRLGLRPDPFLEFLLIRTGEDAGRLSRTGRNAVEVLYTAWIGSGLAREGLPVWLTWWSPDGTSQEELRIGVEGRRPVVPSDLIQEVRRTGVVTIRRFDLADAHYVAAAPMARGAVLTAVVPPRRGLEADSPLGPLFSPARSEPDPLVLVPLLQPDLPEAAGAVRWIPTEEGWQGETFLAYPDELYHGHYILALPGPLLILARGALLLLSALAGVLVLWSAGRRLSRGPGGGLQTIVAALGSFRGRVTLALFFFFLVPTILFGTLAYRTLAGAATRAAESLAIRSAENAAAWFGDVGGQMDLLSARVGSDLLLYDAAQLVSASLRELMELGLYEGWLPSTLSLEMARGEELMATASAALGGWEYVVAYRRMPGGLVLAAPAPLQAGATALRQREITDLLGFALVLGAGLSVLLALLVGRALSRPIQTLQIASERVGSGNMGVHLPEARTDEFGAVFDAFNRMVDRLARTRRELVRTSRRTRAIVEEVATGVIALDVQGRVTLANPRAEALLGTTLEPNRPLPLEGAGAGGSEALVRWVDEYMRDGVAEAGAEFQMGERRIRVRARRIARRGPPGGAVVSLEDVTDELRTERILAWGEMAQQVAHEVKNPLTPIKLGVQHIRRAWEDESPDFAAILQRNVEAVLREIDRLASTASSFSRYGAPASGVGAAPEAVDLEEVVGEVMDLYAAGGGRIRFLAEVPEDLPRVRARRDELKEVLVNLLENARSATVDRGEVRVAAKAVSGAVELRVCDEGTGVPTELLPRVFEPHFSTRSGGSGLGLAIVRRIVESWDGTVSLRSEGDRGTVVCILLRRWDDGGGGDRPLG